MVFNSIKYSKFVISRFTHFSIMPLYDENKVWLWPKKEIWRFGGLFDTTVEKNFLFCPMGRLKK